MAAKKFETVFGLTKRAHLLQIANRLKTVQQPYRNHYQDLADFILPSRSQFFAEDTNNGGLRNTNIIDSTATQSVVILKAGMLSGVTSPARPWFNVSIPDREMAEVDSVRRWLSDVTRRMTDSLLRTNFYNQIQVFYGDLGTFGTAALLVEEDIENVSRFECLPVGSYYVGNNEQNKVDKFYREFSMTVRQVVKRFGFNEDTGEINWDNISIAVKQSWESGNYENEVIVGHLIMPNYEYDHTKAFKKFKKHRGFYFELGSVAKDGRGVEGVKDDKVLLEDGYDLFPVLVCRWEARGQDVYAATCPGMVALGDVMQLQTGESKTLKAIDKTIDPPMVGPTSLKNQRSSILPGDITYVDDSNLGQFRAAHAMNFNIKDMEFKQDQVRTRIRKVFFEDLFLMLANSDRRQITAREIEERHEEKLLALGPVLENLNNDLLDPLMDIHFDHMLRQGRLPEAPEELEGEILKIEYISIMAQAQKLVGLASVDRLTQYVGAVAQWDPNAIKKFNVLEAIDAVAEITGAPPKLVRTDEEVNDMIAAEQQAMKQQAAMEQMQQVAGTAKTLSDTNMEGDSALREVLTGMG